MLDAYMCFYYVTVSPAPDKVEFKAWVDEENYFIHTYEGTYRNMNCMLMVGYNYECNCSFLAMYPINAGDAINHPEYAVMGRLTPSSMSDFVNGSAAGDVASSENGTETDDKNVNKCTLDDDELLATCTNFLKEYLMMDACEDAFSTEDQSYFMVNVEDGEVQKGPRQDVVFYASPEDMYTTEDPLTGELKDPNFQEKNGYYVALSNNIGGIFTYGASAASYRNYAYNDIANYNQGGFYVNDDGVMGFILLFDGWLTEKIAEDSSILSFEILKESFIKEVSENVDPSKLNTDKLYFKNMYLTYFGITNPDDAMLRIADAVKKQYNTYICVSNPRTVVYATRHEDYREVMAHAFMNIPDAEPMTWAAKLWGLKKVKRTMGPIVFNNMLTDKDSCIKHFMLGDTKDTLSQLKQNYEGVHIVGMHSPPFCNLDEYDYPEIAKMINNSGANIVWISMRAPKQDFFATRILPYLDNKICIGVGAAFRFSLGEYRMPPPIIRKLGLMGLFWGKKSQSWPKFIWGYLNDNVPYLWYLAKIPFWKILGKKYYE